MILALADAAVGFIVTAAIYRPGAEVSAQVASRDLKLLVEQGLLIPRGEKRGRSHVGSQGVLAIRAKTREPRPGNDDPFTGK